MEVRATMKQIVLHQSIPPKLPARVLGDPGRLRQVLSNLCDNAIKFTTAGHVTVSLTVAEVGADALDASFAVTDTGIGIPKEKQDLIFAAFSQADASTTRSYGGTGLGLAICASLVELMGGRIRVESVQGQGSTFHFSVRLARESGVVAPVARSEASPSHQVAGTRQLEVLLVEDHPINQMFMSTILKRFGHAVTIAANGELAVAQFASKPWDLILMDVQMPVMGGLEATQLIRAKEAGGQRTPIIGVTAHARQEDRDECIEAGMDAHLPKPVAVADLNAMIERFYPPSTSGPDGTQG
jgi:CheY-like chemotaxis protein